MVLSPRYKYLSGSSVRDLDPIQANTRDQVLNKIADGTYTLKPYPCTVCGETEFKILSEKGRYGIQIPVKICKGCGLIQSNPRLDEASAQSFYEKEYRKLYNLKSAPERFESQYRRSQDIFDYLDEQIEANIRQLSILEIGCGYGGLIAYFQEQDCDVVGCDLDGEAVQYAQEKKLPAIIGDVREVELECEPDIVILDDVLEHMVEPNKIIEYVFQNYSKGTYIYIELPGVKNLDIFNISYRCDFLRYVHIAHTHHFSLTSLQNLMRQTGCRLVNGDERIKALFEVTHDPDDHIKSDYDSVMNHLHRIEKYRWFNNIYRYAFYLRYPDRHPRLIHFLKRTGLYPHAKKLHERISK